MRQLTIAYIGNGKSVNRYHIPYAQTLPEMFRIKTIYARRITHDTWAAVPDVSTPISLPRSACSRRASSGTYSRS